MNCSTSSHAFDCAIRSSSIAAGGITVSFTNLVKSCSASERSGYASASRSESRFAASFVFFRAASICAEIVAACSSFVTD